MSFSQLADNSVLSIIAPTASGKTALAYELYETGKFELISVDSALIYRDMDIGTAKPNASELLAYPHHLVDIISPEEQYDVAQFCQSVALLVKQAHNNNKIPILVGGTMMYYNAMFAGISAVPSSDDEIRKKVSAWIAEAGIADLHKYLQSHDPLSAERLNVADTQRVSRAVEVHLQTGRPLSDWQKLPKNAIADSPHQQWLAYTITPDRAWLHERIALRLSQMWQQGFVNEVIELINTYELAPNMASMRCIGYRQIIDAFLQNELFICKNNRLMSSNLLLDRQNNNKEKTLDETGLLEKTTCQDMRNKALYATRQLAKRQCTWLNKLNKLSKNSSVNVNAFDNIQEVKNNLI